MKSFEFSVGEKFSQDGEAEGYFAVQFGQRRNRSTTRTLDECIAGLENSGKEDEKIIAIFTDENGTSEAFKKKLADTYLPILSGLVTFGSDESAKAAQVPQRTHHEIILRGHAAGTPDFVASMVALPNTVNSNLRWLKDNPLADIHMHYGSVTLQNQLCIITVDESVPALLLPGKA